MAATALGDYLRARRAQVTPEAAGVASYGPRRVPGLRREEVATMAGMSVDYYIRLEQGRENSPSTQVLDCVSQVLRLDDDARQHLYQLAGLTPRPYGTGARAQERVDPSLLALIGMWPDNPAIVLGRAYDVLAGNRMGYALFDGFQQGPNLMLKIFLDPGARDFYRDWELVAANTVAGFRLLEGRAPHDPRIRDVLGTLTEQSPDFVRMWARHDARRRRLERKRFRHPEVGDLTLRIQAFDVKSAPGQELIVYHAEPESASAGALKLLGTITATRAYGPPAG